MARHAKMTIACGRRLTGKTNKTLEQCYAAVTHKEAAKRRKVLIFDPMDEFGSYIFRPDQPPHSIKKIFLKDVRRFSLQTTPEIVRVIGYHDNGKRMGTDDMQEALGEILKNYRNGILLVEDINKYVSDSAPNDIVGSMATLRQAGVDLIVHYQLVQKAAHPKLLGMANYIRLHKTNDQVARFKDRFLDKTDMMCVAEIIVNRRYHWGMENDIKNDTGMFFSVLVDLEYNKIRGIFTKHEAELAVDEFISRNASMTIGSELQRVTKQGKKFWPDYQSAYSYLEKKMMKDFFCF